MKKYLLIVFVFVFVFTLTGCSSDNEDIAETSIRYSRLSFGSLEEDSEYVGTYWVERTNLGQSWIERGEWKSLELNFDSITKENHVCFGYFGMNNSGSFRTKEGYSWNPCKFQGRDCLCLEKDKDK